MSTTEKTFKSPFYPIVYVRGYAMRRADIEETFYDSYYGFATTAVYKKQTIADQGYLVPDLFEGQLIRFMKSRFKVTEDEEYTYADAVNCKPEDFRNSNPTQSIWISRFYDVDYMQDKVRSIEEHAAELMDLIINKIPAQLKKLGVPEDELKNNYKVILIAHSMGGLVCRTLLQNTLAGFKDHRKEDDRLIPEDRIKNPSDIIHKFVTIGTPHKGIDMGNIPDFVEQAIVSTINPYDANIFQPKRMREYLKLGDKNKKGGSDEYRFDLHSLGNSNFPAGKCLCMIGSDYSSYSVVRIATGSFSDGLVKQDRAYLVTGEKPADGKSYPENAVAYYANVHRAHSGIKGIVNSYETFENIQRFLFGDLKVRLALQNVAINTNTTRNAAYFYDFEFSLSIRGTGVYLHQRKQDPCENAIRYNREALTPDKEIYLHTGFLNSKLMSSANDGSHFIIKIGVIEYKIEKGWLWDTQYPSRSIYTESLEIKVLREGDTYRAWYSWQSDNLTWEEMMPETNGDFRIPLSTHPAVRKTSAVTGDIVIRAEAWK